MALARASVGRPAARADAGRCRARATRRATAPRALDCGEIACAMDASESTRAVTINGRLVRARTLRDVVVRGADDREIRLGDVARGSPSVVVLLRHLG